MKNINGIARKMDALGRVCVPVEMRKLCNMHPGDFVEMSVNDGGVQLKRYIETDERLTMLNELLRLASLAVGKAIFLLRGKVILASSVPLSEWAEWHAYLQHIADTQYVDRAFQAIGVAGHYCMVSRPTADLIIAVPGKNLLDFKERKVLERCVHLICTAENRYFHA